MNNGIEISHINKSYGNVQALKDVTLTINPGELFGLIGPDGAGKTTLFRILTTLLVPDNGKASVCGLDIQKHLKDIRSQVGYMPGRFSLYQDLTVEENLKFFATVFNTTVQDNYELISDIYSQIEPFKYRLAGKLSGGMKQKLALCCALVHKPDVLFLDEPTTGVDPVSRAEFWSILKRLKQQGITIFVSTPYMDEASRCDRIALIRGGQILSTDTPQTIQKGFKYPLLAVKTNSQSMYPLLKDLRSYTHTILCFSFGDVHHLTLKENLPEDTTIKHLKTYLLQKGYNDIHIQKIEPSIEDCFMLL